MNDLLKGTGVNSACCTPEPPDYDALCGEDKQRFGPLVNQKRKQGMSLDQAQKIAYQQVTCDSIPFDEPTGR